MRSFDVKSEDGVCTKRGGFAQVEELECFSQYFDNNYLVREIVNMTRNLSIMAVLLMGVSAMPKDKRWSTADACKLVDVPNITSTD